LRERILEVCPQFLRRSRGLPVVACGASDAGAYSEAALAEHAGNPERIRNSIEIACRTLATPGKE